MTRLGAEIAAWVERELANAPDLTQEQIRELRRLLLPPQPIAKPA